MTRRLFNRSEKSALYRAANGKCTVCGVDLQQGWHGDHIYPYSAGGATDVVNGQALCPTCNIRKGRIISMTYVDEFKPRPFQRDLGERVLQRCQAGERLTVADASPGSGKTLAHQYTATLLMREGLIDRVAVYAPRLGLATQCELEWRSGEAGHYNLFDPACRLERILHRSNKPPLTDPGDLRTGFVTTYQSLGSDRDLHLDWASRHRGRFLLVADEAQFCGADDIYNSGPAGGTVSGELITQLAGMAFHTLLLTGTPYRSDGGKIILAQYQLGDDGKEHIASHVRAGYADGIAEGYLRPFEAQLIDADVTTEDRVTKEHVKQPLSENAAIPLMPVLRQEHVWQPLADHVVSRLMNVQQSHPGYKALIACQEQKDARRVFDYVSRNNPSLTVRLAVSEDGDQAQIVMREFKSTDADILVTVRMAYIGYDCKQITVVGLLTNFRDTGHLKQLVGRGLRVWDKMPVSGQVTHIVAPDDPEMKAFLNALQEEREEGRTRRRDGGEGGEGPQDSRLMVEDAYATTTRSVGHFGEVDNDELELYENVMFRRGITGSAGQFKQALEDLNEVTSIKKPRPTAEPIRPAMTEREQIKASLAQSKEILARVIRRKHGVHTGPAFQKLIIEITTAVNKAQKIKGTAEITTVEKAQERLSMVRSLEERAS